MATFATTPDFKRQFMAAAEEVLANKQPGQTLTADDIWAQLTLRGVENRAADSSTIGGIFQSLAKRGLIRNTERSVKSRRGVGKGRRISVWEVCCPCDCHYPQNKYVQVHDGDPCMCQLGMEAAR